jgi:ornithine cyclodeaminase
LRQLQNSCSVSVPPRIVMPTAAGNCLFCMPATDGQVVMTKLISFTPGNARMGRPTIQGDIVVFDAATGVRQLILDGPTVTARRTAAVSLLAARRLAPRPQGALLIVGAGVQGSAHLQAFAQGLGTQEVWIHSRSASSAQRLADEARDLGLHARITDDLEEAARHCPLIVTCTPAQAVVLHEAARPDAFVCAVGAFTPQMVELDPELCRRFLHQGQIVVDTADARTRPATCCRPASRSPPAHAGRRGASGLVALHEACTLQILRLGRLGSGRHPPGPAPAPAQAARLNILHLLIFQKHQVIDE